MKMSRHNWSLAFIYIVLVAAGTTALVALTYLLQAGWLS